MKDSLVIANPASAGGRTGKRWADIAAGLRAAGLDFDYALTTRALEATEFSRKAVKEGRSLVVAAGGDGTINEVANGFFENGEPIPAQARFGVLPTGTGGDFRRTFGLPVDMAEAGRMLVVGKSRRIDVGRVTFTAPGGGQGLRHFVNIADAGVGGEVINRVNRGRKLINGEVTFYLASVRTLLGWRNKPMHVEIDGVERDLVAQQVVVANCRYYGGGMMIAPAAIPDDGLLDVILSGDLGTLEWIRGLGDIRNGRQFDKPNPKLEHLLARKVVVTSPQTVHLDVDGEGPGVLPATFEVMPSVLDLVCP